MFEREKMCSKYEASSSILIQDAVKKAILTKNRAKRVAVALADELREVSRCQFHR